MNRIKSWLHSAAGIILIAAASVLAVVVAILTGLTVGILRALFKALPWLLIILVIIWACTGCVYQPIHVEVWVPTDVIVGGDVVLDTVGNKLSEVAK